MTFVTGRRKIAGRSFTDRTGTTLTGISTGGRFRAFLEEYLSRNDCESE
jgi:hypothetical protein